MKIYFLKQLNQVRLNRLCKRKAIQFDALFPVVKEIIEEVKNQGDKAVKDYTKKFDGAALSSFIVTEKEINEASQRLTESVKLAFRQAALNIKKFHETQIIKRKGIETMPGVSCFSEGRPIEKVGLYIPGGTAPLPSTVLMLAIPAKLAGCREIIMTTPPNREGRVDDIILYAARQCGVKNIFKIGGAQAIAAMGYGTESVPKVYKIFGPGNQYVTAAKMLVSIDPEGAAIDMPAGPTEAFIIADEKARADFAASDILSQAEHGTDSQVILVSTDEKKVREVLRKIREQLSVLPRQEIAKIYLKNSFALLVETVAEAIKFSNLYAPEHLILNVRKPEKYINSIINVGSVFLGSYACESAGDYASGANHSLPTYGYSRVYGGLSVSSFQKQITFQKLTKQGAKNLGPVVSTMAEQESLEGHKRAMELRYK